MLRLLWRKDRSITSLAPALVSICLLRPQITWATPTALSPSKGSLVSGFPRTGEKNTILSSSLAIGCKLIHLRATRRNCGAILLPSSFAVCVCMLLLLRFSGYHGLRGWVRSGVKGLRGLPANRNKRAANKVSSVFCFPLCVCVFALCTWLNMQSYG